MSGRFNVADYPDLFRDPPNKLPNHFLKIGEVDTTPILNWINSKTEADWLADSMRQTKFAVHKDTQSIVFKWCENTSTTGEVTTTNYYASFAHLVEPILTKIQEFYNYPKPTIRKMMLAKLRAGGVITEHTDGAIALRLVHRIHVPITTNNDVHFYISGKDHKFGVGEIVEIDNVRFHAVENFGKEDRIHLIIDYYREL